MPKVLVTGGAGFMGSHLVDYLIETLDFDVVVLDDLSGGFKENVHPRAVFIPGSITDDSLVQSLFKENRFDYVYHLAAYAAEGLSHFIKRFNYTNNLIGSVNLINAAVNTAVNCFVFTSSMAVYGSNQLPMSEDLVPLPEDPYGIAKNAVEMELKVSRRMFDLNYVIFRPHNVYGERQNMGDRYRNVIGIFMNRILQGKALEIFGDGEQRRAFTYVGDIIPAIAKSAFTDEAKNRTLNIGADSHHSINELAALVSSAMGASVLIRHVAPRVEVKNAYCDHTEFQRVFNELSQTPLAKGLEMMAPWAKARGAVNTKPFEAIEIPKRMPPIWQS